MERWRGMAATVRDLGTKPVGRNENVHPRFGLSQPSAGEKGKGVRFGKWRDMTHLHKCKKRKHSQYHKEGIIFAE